MKKLGYISLGFYVATVFVANWLIAHFGAIPVGFGLVAPAGVYAAGLAFTLRDLVQDSLGKRWVVVGILCGAAASAAVSPSLAIASGSAFLFSEFADFVVYTPIREGGRPYVGVLVSNSIGLLCDSMLFLWLAFHSFAFLPGQLVGKAWMTLAAMPLVWGYRRALLPRLTST